MKIHSRATLKAFTLTELLVTIGILMLIALPTLMHVKYLSSVLPFLYFTPF